MTEAEVPPEEPDSADAGRCRVSSQKQIALRLRKILGTKP